MKEPLRVQIDACDSRCAVKWKEFGKFRDEVKNPTLSHKKRQGWGTLKIIGRDRLRKSSRGLLPGCTLVVLWVNHETAIRAFAFAFSLKIGFVAQGQVDDAALARRHGAEVVRSPSLADFLGGDVGCGAQFLNAHGAAILAVEADFLVLPGSQVQHLEREQFKGAQQLSAAIEQKCGVGAGEVDENFRLLPVAILRERRVDDDAVLEVKTAVSDNGLKELVDLIGGSDFVHKAAFSYQPSAFSERLSGFSIQCGESLPKG